MPPKPLPDRPLARRSVLAGLVGATALTALGSSPAWAGARRHRAEDPATVVARAFPAAEPERLRLATTYRGSDFIPTGHYAPAGATVTVRVDPVDGILPTLHVGTYDNHPDDPNLTAPRAVTLTAGVNTFTDAYGGPLHLRLAGDGERAIVTFLSGAVRMPTFTLDSTTEGEFQDQLDTLTDSLYVELVSPHALVTVTRASFLPYRGEDHTALMRIFEQVIDSHAAVAGLDGSSPLHRRKAGPYQFSEVPKVPTGVGAYATHYYNAFPPAYMDRLLTVGGLSTRGWGLYHELGHLHQQFAYRPAGLTEVSVNIYSLAAQRVLGQTSNLLTVNASTGLNYFQTALPKLGTDGLSFASSFGAYEKLVSLRQLELAFGTDIWPKLHRLIRVENPQSDWATQDALRWTTFAVCTSRVTGYDLSDFYLDKWAYPIDADGVAALAALGLPEPPVDPSTLSD
ncbi:M60 family metallopeptidase [Streptomyces sp. VRA16 Mangrove soil]|uniref:M60 family metallopeptidase n=1 Tax=Streptomyces sp. VRA16 Mangrove soil TaxID=2817434 RepID=UPI001E32FE74|nr:M60 family metallopeptidase [Streptomyces sp. VRA16 Mangrove soil]